VAGPAASHARYWGYHELQSRLASRIVADAAIRPGQLVVDIGAGTGALTARLVEAGAHVVAVELHPARAARLRARFADAPVRIVQADAATLRLPRRPFRVVANPPFGLTTQIIRRLLGPGSQLVTADLVVPRPVLRRWMDPGAPGRGRWSRTHTVGPGRRIPRAAFNPPAPADCVVVAIRRR
jgi:23S rRNA (adenine-N6)-dimethyltransferase